MAKENSVVISFKNNGNYDLSCLYAPITKDGKTIGVIDYISDDIVQGII